MKTTITLIAILFSLATNIANADVSASRKYKDVTDYLHKIAQANPQNAELFTLGFSDAGIAIEGLKIGSGLVHNLVVGTHHGNEYGSTEIALNFADAIAQSPIKGQTLYVIPVLNIDGYNARQRWERINGQYIDPNRDYPGPCGSEGPFHSRSTKALADFIVKEDIVASATLHTFWPAAVYPWGLSTEQTDTPYTPIFMKMVEAATSATQYQTGNSTDVIYPADGTFEDYAFWKQGVWSILFELGNTHSPSARDLDAWVKQLVPGLRNMFEIAPQTRAEKHDFTGKCSLALRSLDLHIE